MSLRIGISSLYDVIPASQALLLARMVWRISNSKKTFDDFPCVLDWGCGSGRVLRYVAARHRVNLRCVDIDADNIGWCKTAF
jgi:2-polyprenyl-3-methyl-5-hydroxy-6-metoxy-1,4-benzoquinol methylase